MLGLIGRLFNRLSLKIATNTFYQILGRLISSLIAVLTTRAITSHLGIDGFGNYQIILTYASMLWILTDLGLNAIAVKRIAGEPSREQEEFSLLLTARFLLSLFLGLGLVIASLMLPYPPIIRWGIAMVSVTVIAQGVRGACGALFQYRLRYDLQLISVVAGAVVFLIGVYFSTQSGWGIVGLVVSLILQCLLTAGGFLFFATRWVRLGFTFDWPRLRRLVTQAAPFGVALVFSLLNSKLDTFLLSLVEQPAMSSAVAVGHYSLGFKIFEFVLAVPVFYMNVLYPILVKHYERRSKQSFARVFKKSLLVLLNLAVWGGLVLYLISPYLIDIIAEDVDITPGTRVLRVLTLSSPIFFVTGLIMWVLVVFGKQKELIRIYLIGFLFSLILNILLIPHYSYLAPAVVKGLTEVVILIQLVFVTWNGWKELA